MAIWAKLMATLWTQRRLSGQITAQSLEKSFSSALGASGFLYVKWEVS